MKLPGFSRSGETKQLVIVSCIWKALLLVLAAFCPGPGYDTSALVLLDSSPQRHSNFNALTRHERFVLNLLRWDAFYFVKSAERGHVHEQAWAFSWAYSHLLRLAGQLTAGNAQPSLHYYVLAGIVASNVCHLLSVLVLYRLLTLVLEPQRRQIIPFIAAVLHILTPASLFLCAPYAEAMFSFLNFTGMLFYAQSRTMAETGKSSFGEDLLKISSGLFFAVATLMRSNGLLSGTIFLYDVARYLPRLMSLQLSVHDECGTLSLLDCIEFASVHSSGTGYVALARLECYNPSQRSSEPVAWASCTSGQCNVQSQERNFHDMQDAGIGFAAITAGYHGCYQLSHTDRKPDRFRLSDVVSGHRSMAGRLTEHRPN
ncbi:GPI mannosyltransferase 2 [Pyrenophora tritici-repentis]|nr:GPI mannosyltransferase 2 [Pyrenophora tritici-repentis]KAI0613985.1 GPI mannosyltransferase 2 [Pyrenophora tritici-repentis]